MQNRFDMPAARSRLKQGKLHPVPSCWKHRLRKTSRSRW